MIEKLGETRVNTFFPLAYGQVFAIIAFCFIAEKPMTTKISNRQSNKIRVRLKAFDHRILDEAVRKIVQSVLATGSQVVGPVPMPTQRKSFTVLQSPHTDKNSREHFEMLTHIRVLDILNPTGKTIDSLMHLELPAGVGIQIKN